MKPVENVRQFMEAIWTNTSKQDTARQFFRGQTKRWSLLPKLYRDPLRESQALKTLGDGLARSYSAIRQ